LTLGAELSSSETPQEPLAWSVDATAHRPGAKYVIALVAVGAFFFGLYRMQSPLAGILGAVIVLGSSIEAFFPVKYRLDDTGASRKVGFAETAMLWEDVKRVEVSERAVRLSPLEKPTRLDAFRGVSLRFSSNREAVLAKISDHVHDYVGNLERRSEPGGGSDLD